MRDKSPPSLDQTFLDNRSPPQWRMAKARSFPLCTKHKLFLMPLIQGLSSEPFLHLHKQKYKSYTSKSNWSVLPLGLIPWTQQFSSPYSHVGNLKIILCSLTWVKPISHYCSLGSVTNPLPEVWLFSVSLKLYFSSFPKSYQGGPWRSKESGILGLNSRVLQISDSTDMFLNRHLYCSRKTKSQKES